MRKDKKARNEYFKDYMASKRKGLTKGAVKPDEVLNPDVKPCTPENLNPYPKSDYRYYLTPPDIEGRVPEDYVKKFRQLPLDVQRGILSVLAHREQKGLAVNPKERIDGALRYQKWLKGRILDKPVLEAVK